MGTANLKEPASGFLEVESGWPPSDGHQGVYRMSTFCQDCNDSQMLPSLADLDASNIQDLGFPVQFLTPILGDALCLLLPFHPWDSQVSQSHLIG